MKMLGGIFFFSVGAEVIMFHMEFLRMGKLNYLAAMLAYTDFYYSQERAHLMSLEIRSMQIDMARFIFIFMFLLSILAYGNSHLVAL